MEVTIEGRGLLSQSRLKFRAGLITQIQRERYRRRAPFILDGRNYLFNAIKKTNRLQDTFFNQARCTARETN